MLWQNVSLDPKTEDYDSVCYDFSRRYGLNCKICSGRESATHLNVH